MTKPDDELQRLWLSQKVTSIDTHQIKQDCRKQTLKQRMYTLMDFVCLIPLVILLVISWEEMSKPAALMMSVLCTVMIALLGYMTRLRWIAVSGFHSTTATFLDMLIKQMNNNAQIALLTKHSCWATVLFLVSFYAVMYFLGELTADKITKALIAVGVVSLLMPVIYWWANKREHRFRRKAQQLRELKSSAE